MPAILTTNDITMPTELSAEIFSKAQLGSVIAALASSEPQKFGKTEMMTFDTRPKAEFVGESGDKASSPADFGLRTVIPFKAQVTMRTSDEVLWADEDYQLGVIEEMANAAAEALSRALDIGAVHGINPLTGQPSTIVGNDYKLSDAGNAVTAGDEPDLDIEAAAGLVIAKGYRPRGIALDLSYAWTIATLRYEDGRKKYPDLGLGIEISRFEGLPAAVSDTVSAAHEAAAATKLLGVVGDWTAFRWGVQRDIGISVIEFGDPDGKGDLKRKNQVALRAEMVFGWCWIDKAAFALIKAA